MDSLTDAMVAATGQGYVQPVALGSSSSATTEMQKPLQHITVLDQVLE